MEPEIPSNAPQSCPGTSSLNAGKSNGCEGCPNQKKCASGGGGKLDEEVVNKIVARMAEVKSIILVMSGKGGVGKSSISATLAWSLSSLQRNRRIGLLDVDITGPSMSMMMGCDGETVHQSGSGWSPVFVDENLELMSVAMLLADPDQAIVWRGPKKNKLIENMLTDVNWSELDHLIIDTPPGTTDEHMSLAQLLTAAGVLDRTRVVFVSTNQEVSLSSVRKQVAFCSKVGLTVAGVVGNMHSHRCTQCGYSTELFPCTTGGVEEFCREFALPLLSQLPIDSHLTRCLDEGVSVMTMDDDYALSDETMDAVEVMVGSLLKILDRR